MSERKRERAVGERHKKALKRGKDIERKSIKKIEDFLCSVSLEILEVTSLSARLSKQNSKNIFQDKEMRPYTIWEVLY